jgi:hypothetical protein
VQEVLSRRALNRATLERQLLLRRARMSPLEAIEHLVGLQAQTPHSWYGGLWSRLEEFDPESVSDLMNRREVVRIALMRATIHLVSARDCLALRPLVQPVVESGMRGALGRRLDGLDRAELVAAARELLDERPLTFQHLGKALAERWPGRDAAALAQAVRAWVPLVQVPPRGLWGRSGPVAHTSMETWLGGPATAEPPMESMESMVLRYLAAFGPASVKDIQAWSGLTRLREVVDRLGTRLVALRDEQGRELLDLPDAPRPDPGTPAPARLLYDFDNLLLSHDDRGRFVTDGYRAQPFPANGLLPAIVLLDGFTSGTWRLTRDRKAAVVTIRPFRKLSVAEIDEVGEEADLLVSFLAAEAETRDIRFLPAG